MCVEDPENWEGLNKGGTPSLHSDRSAPNRLYVLDIVRFFAFLAIVSYHQSYAFWARFGHLGDPINSPWMIPVESYSRFWVFSGFSVMFLSFVLFGYKVRASRRNLWLVLAAFFAIWCVTAEDFPYVWDVYPFLLASLALLALVRALKVPP